MIPLPSLYKVYHFTNTNGTELVGLSLNLDSVNYLNDLKGATLSLWAFAFVSVKLSE